MKALKFSTHLPLLALTLLTCFAQINLSVAAQTEIIRVTIIRRQGIMKIWLRKQNKVARESRNTREV